MTYRFHPGRIILALLFGGTLAFSSGCSAPNEDASEGMALKPDTIRVVMASYFPVVENNTSGKIIDKTKTGDWGESLDFTRKKVDSVATILAHSLEKGSIYHGYKLPAATPSLVYKIVDRQEYLQALPTFERSDKAVPMTDYAAIFEQIEGQKWVLEADIDEFWIWGYHGGVLDLWESNMSSPSGDISNSDRITNDLPVLNKTFTVYHYNYQRGAAEAVENHMHQFEAVINSFDGRDTTPAKDWPNLLFWGKFVGSDSTHKLLDPRRAGWSHYPPNAEKDYEWANPEAVISDIENWDPDGFTQGQDIECSRWNCDHLGWFIYWMQNIPGRENRVSYNGNDIRNWWSFLSHYDAARRENWKLWEER